MARLKEPTWSKCLANRTRSKRLCVALATLIPLPLLWPVRVRAAQVPGTSPACQQAATQVEEGKRLFAQKAYPLAVREFRSALDACPQNQAAIIGLTRTYLAARQFSSAEQSALRLLVVDPRSEDGQFLLAYSYFMQERYPEAGKLLRQLLARDPDNAGAHKLMGLTLFFYKEYSTAEHELSAALQKDPGDREALYYLGRIYATQSDVQPAIEIFLKLVALDPDDYKSADNLALCYEGVGRGAEAEAMFKKAQEAAKKKDPAYDWAYSNLAEMLITENRATEAVAYASQALKINPRSPRNNYLLGAALAAKGEAQAALPYLQKSIELDSNLPEPHQALGKVYQRLHDPEAAEREFKLFAEIKKRTPAKKQ
jgi:tetratricopeptide (TPR) repeat protein